MSKRSMFIIAAALVVVIAGAIVGRNIYATARLGTTYVAKQTCSCLFVAGRSPKSCQTDYDPNDLSRLTVAAATNSVTVSALGGVVSARADFAPGFGCHPAN